MNQFFLLFAFLLYIGLTLAQTTAPAKAQFTTTTKSVIKKQQAFRVELWKGDNAYAYPRFESCAELAPYPHTILAVSQLDTENNK